MKRQVQKPLSIGSPVNAWQHDVTGSRTSNLATDWLDPTPVELVTCDGVADALRGVQLSVEAGV